jgi:high affinity sulfate transporter 1
VSLLTRARPFIGPALRSSGPYGRAGLRDDVTAGVLLTALLVPAGMAYAEVAGLPVVSGLHATIAGLVVYALVGPSRILVLGPDSSLAPIIGAAVIPLAAGDPDQALALAGLLAVLVGLILIVGGLLRLGMVTDLLSKPIRVGYLNGIALVVIVSQLPKLFGFSVDGDGLVDDLSGFAEGLGDGELNVAAAILGVSALAIILGMRWRSPRLPALLVAVVGASLVLWLGDLDEVPVVGALPSGLPAPALGGLDWGDVLSLLPAAAGVALVAFADTSVLSRAFAAKEDQVIDENREMAATGAANVGCGLFGGFPISGSSSRTPVAQQSGARTQLAGLVGAACVAILIIVAPGLTEYLPSSVLAAVVIAAVMSLADIPTVAGLWRMRRSEFLMSMAAFVGVALFGVLEGIGIAVVLSLVAFVVKAWRPHTAELVRIDGRKGYHDLSRNPRGKRIPGLLIIRFDAPIFFANSAEFSRFVRDSVNHAPEPVEWVILAAEPITDVDITGRDTMLQLVRDMRDHDLHLVFAELKGPVRDRFVRYGITEELGKDRFFPTIGTAVSAYLRATDAHWVDWTDR